MKPYFKNFEHVKFAVVGIKLRRDRAPGFHNISVGRFRAGIELRFAWSKVKNWPCLVTVHSIVHLSRVSCPDRGVSWVVATAPGPIVAVVNLADKGGLSARSSWPLKLVKTHRFCVVFGTKTYPLDVGDLQVPKENVTFGLSTAFRRVLVSTNEQSCTCWIFNFDQRPRN